jgi:hypothetical protein
MPDTTSPHMHTVLSIKVPPFTHASCKAYFKTRIGTSSAEAEPAALQLRVTSASLLVYRCGGLRADHNSDARAHLQTPTAHGARLDTM